MIRIFEGLNGSGKSTVIKRYIDQGVGELIDIPLTDFSNPLKWRTQVCSSANSMCCTTFKVDHIALPADNRTSYVFGIYETVAYYLKNKKNLTKDIYLDRSFLTAAVYETCTMSTCLALLALYADLFGDDLEFVFLDTPITTCVSRRESSTDKNYAILDPAKQKWLYDRFKAILKQANALYGIKFVLSNEGML